MKTEFPVVLEGSRALTKHRGAVRNMIPADKVAGLSAAFTEHTGLELFTAPDTHNPDVHGSMGIRLTPEMAADIGSYDIALTVAVDTLGELAQQQGVTFTRDKIILVQPRP